MSLTVDAGTPVATNYQWDVNRSLPVVTMDGTNTYVCGHDLISATDGSSNQTYFTYDGLGSTTDLTNGTGTVTDTYSYDVFGAVRASTSSTANVWQFTGEQHDVDSDLYYLRARHYDPATGRFLGQDPWKGISSVPKTQTPYAYAMNAPTNYIDPTGMTPGGGEGTQFATVVINP